MFSYLIKKLFNIQYAYCEFGYKFYKRRIKYWINENTFIVSINGDEVYKLKDIGYPRAYLER